MSALDLTKAGFVIVDVQNDFISGTLSLSSCPSKHSGEQVVPVINKVLAEKSSDFGAIVYTQDWHPENHISFYENRGAYGAPDANLFENVTLTRSTWAPDSSRTNEYDQIMWPAHCIEETWGAELHKDLTIESGDKVINIKKGINSHAEAYSAFFDNYQEYETDLDKQLRAKDIEELYICGLGGKFQNDIFNIEIGSLSWGGSLETCSKNDFGVTKFASSHGCLR